MFPSQTPIVTKRQALRWLPPYDGAFASWGGQNLSGERRGGEFSSARGFDVIRRRFDQRFDLHDHAVARRFRFAWIALTSHEIHHSDRSRVVFQVEVLPTERLRRDISA